MAPSTSETSLGLASPRIKWPDGKAFAFTVFDDPDFQSVERGARVYEFLREHGFRTTKGVWPGDRSLPDSARRATCADPEYLKWVQGLQESGFEIGWHGAAPRTSLRAQTLAAFDVFRDLFGEFPKAMSQHYECRENLYWGDLRLTAGLHRFLYNLSTLWKNHRSFHGHVPGHLMYWGDVCRDRVKYVRNFVFADVNTLAACPFMPYHDPERPDVNYWYASSEGHNLAAFTRMLSEANQDRLEAEGGACIMYSHFAYGFVQNGTLNGRFRELMERLSKKNGWFVTVSELLDYIARNSAPVEFGPDRRAALERRWLMHKLRFGTA